MQSINTINPKAVIMIKIGSNPLAISDFIPYGIFGFYHCFKWILTIRLIAGRLDKV